MTGAVVNPASHIAAIEILWARGLAPGDRTGWPSVDRHYTVEPGQLTVLTGWPGSGKSEWLDALLVNLARQGWKHAVFSPENAPAALHVAKLLEKITGKPFGAGPTERIQKADLPELLDELGQGFGFVIPKKSDTLSIEAVLEAAELFYAKSPEAKHGLVIDPWNELEHWRPRELSETEYVSMTLSKLRAWARPT
jgi:twinkle protein